MQVRFWGTRGSIATPGPRTARYGGNTSCVSIRAADGTLIVLDCGTGARELGLHLLKTEPQPLRLHLFIGHTHWDHIQGFPFFVPAFTPEAEINVYAPAGFQRSLEGTLAGQMQYSYFPIKLHDLRSRIHFTELEEGFFRVGNVLVETQHLNHTAPTIAYRISSGGATVVYAADHEPFWNPAHQAFQHPGDQRHVTFLRDADLVIHDAQYGDEEYDDKRGWGHSTVEYATDVALAAGVQRLVLFHHDPTHDDIEVERLEARARARGAAGGTGLEVIAAAEGLELDVAGSGRTSAVADSSALRLRPIAGRRVMIVSADETDVAAIGQVLMEDQLALQPVPDRQTALDEARDIAPDLVIVDDHLPDGDGVALVPKLRSRLRRPRLPVILLTQDHRTEAVLDGTDDGATDYVATPFSASMLRTRVQAWLARSEPNRRSAARRGRGRRGDVRALDQRDAAQILAGTPIFRSLGADHLRDLADQATEREFWPGQVIIHQGGPADRLYVIISGRVRIVESLPDAPQVEMTLGELGPGEIFGEAAILGDESRSASALSAERTRCLVIPREAFLVALRASPDLCLGLLRMLSHRIFDANRLLARYAPDLLTGLAGRRALLEQYQRLAARVQRNRSHLMLLALDVVHLKEINDHYSYAVGDEVLRTIADALMQATRTTDFVSRSGGDEFVAILEDAGAQDIDVVIDRIRRIISDLTQRRGLPAQVRCSIGVAVSGAQPESIDDLLRAADEDRNRRQTTSLLSAD
ncbi:MAG TPA: diguanylate cyclase [Dehalococcoidia bacterium]|nr:diguanylate cyclase [Dehalococcoidia bacterium]